MNETHSRLYKKEKNKILTITHFKSIFIDFSNLHNFDNIISAQSFGEDIQAWLTPKQFLSNHTCY